MIQTHIAAGLAGAVIAGGIAWQTQAWRYGEQIESAKATSAAQLAQANADAAVKQASLMQQLQIAQDEYAKREKKLRADASAARNALYGLRDTTAAIRRDLPGYSLSAAVVAADTGAELLQQCAERYSTVAEAADRHAADAVMLRDAWPSPIQK